jgi:hypothetical protein
VDATLLSSKDKGAIYYGDETPNAGRKRQKADKPAPE